MKWIVFLGALLGIVPLLSYGAIRSTPFRRALVGLIAFSVFHTADINIISHETYRGDSSGIEVTTIDLMALSLFVAQRVRGARPFEGFRFTWSRMLYLGAVLLSLTAAPLLLHATYSVWKLLRMFFAFSVLATEFTDLASVRAALIGLGAGVLSQGLWAMKQRYIDGMHRLSGSQPHPNSLGMLVNLVTPTALALMLAGHKRRFNAAIVATGAVCVILSLSRGAILMFAVSAALVIAGSLAKDFKLRKLAVVGSLMVGGVALLVKSIDTILARFDNAPKASEEARVLFNMAAEAMAKDHALGIGINMYSHVLEHGGYADRFELATMDRNGIAHHIYWLTAAELGYAGLAAYLLMLAVIIVAAMRAATIRDIRGDIALGITAGLAVTYIQGTAEWVARQTRMSYAFWLLAALVSGLLAMRARERARATAQVGARDATSGPAFAASSGP